MPSVDKVRSKLPGVRQPLYPVLVVNAIILGSDQSILLTRREDNGLWCLPGGYVEIGETAAGAVAREVNEDICVDVTVTKLHGLYSASNRIITSPALRHIVVASFGCEITRGLPRPGDEVVEVAYFRRDALPTLVPNQLVRIDDALSGRRHAAFD